MDYCIQNDRTDHTKSEIKKVVMWPRKSNIRRFGLDGGFLTDFSNFSAPIQLFQFLFSWLTLCDLCGNFEYNKPQLYDNIYWIPHLAWIWHIKLAKIFQNINQHLNFLFRFSNIKKQKNMYFYIRKYKIHWQYSFWTIL